MGKAPDKLVTVERDGNAWCLKLHDFVDLQQSPALFFDDEDEAMRVAEFVSEVLRAQFKKLAGERRPIEPGEIVSIDARPSVGQVVDGTVPLPYLYSEPLEAFDAAAQNLEDAVRRSLRTKAILAWAFATPGFWRAMEALDTGAYEFSWDATARPNKMPAAPMDDDTANALAKLTTIYPVVLFGENAHRLVWVLLSPDGTGAVVYWEPAQEEADGDDLRKRYRVIDLTAEQEEG